MSVILNLTAAPLTETYFTPQLMSRRHLVNFRQLPSYVKVTFCYKAKLLTNLRGFFQCTCTESKRNWTLQRLKPLNLNRSVRLILWLVILSL